MALSDGLGMQFFLLPALIILALLVIGLALGLAGTVYLVGKRLFPEATEWRQMLRGALILIPACLTPLIGWFIIFPYLSGLGVGAFIISWFRKPA